MLRLFSPRLVCIEEKYVILFILMPAFTKHIARLNAMEEATNSIGIRTPDSSRKDEERLNAGDTDVTLIEEEEEQEADEEESEHEEATKA